MEELGEAIRNWIATAIIVFLILLGTVVYWGIKEVTATAKVKNIEPGDKFKVETIHLFEEYCKRYGIELKIKNRKK